ncbi:hypothetical protein LTR56_000756 [Elasticomyces elasticus]|nr:hypothetical protein LTR22_009088 [Elasticomyces elasticus]KAK3660380.1 hypothetical protein LTR56_000756 [Elasticomyces elasticus]KAK4929229.1 hypothetical protein LTR49_004126 [Elasticomyces elasticus]KAK5765785.1 hypothetical protein LTS12_004045 [Elasticomyces elasticus]
MAPSLLTIPPELRTRIWELALKITDTPPVICQDSANKDKTLKVCTYKFDNQAIQPSLTKTNRQVRAETLPMFYGRNTFELGYGLGREWLSCIGEHATHLRCLRANASHYSEDITAIVYLSAFVGTVSRADVHVHAARLCKLMGPIDLVDLNTSLHAYYPTESVILAVQDIFEGLGAKDIDSKTWLRVLGQLEGYFSDQAVRLGDGPTVMC